ncbi:hypothetical protein BDR07DRAFT_1376716 [Suillus spraguei]|nr:hypothetical protein BDR07DRAFT_1376716 [Suillus spraguei]
MRVDKLLADASQILGHCPTPVKAVQFVGGSSGGAVVMRENRSIGSYNIKDGGSISILFSGPGPGGVVLPEYRKNRFKNEDNLQSPPSSPRAKKPVIYLYSPSDIDVSVKLSLIPEWTLSAFYPVVVTEDHRQRLEWNVLGLHTEARTSFISYWLSSILKHKYIALRFVPQSVYERAASLTISPQPDVVTRVFMLFRGASEEHLANWVQRPNASKERRCLGVRMGRDGVRIYNDKTVSGKRREQLIQKCGVQKSKAMHLYEFESIIEMRSGTLSDILELRSKAVVQYQMQECCRKILNNQLDCDKPEKIEFGQCHRLGLFHVDGGKFRIALFDICNKEDNGILL